MLAAMCDLEAGGFIHTIHDSHLYETHIDATKKQIARTPKDFPTLKINNCLNFGHITNCLDVDEFMRDFITLENYNPDKAIKAKLVT